MNCDRALNIEDGPSLLRYLRETGRLEPTEAALFTSLPGGISNRTVLVERADRRRLVLKQALPKLRVATNWPSDPRRIYQEALGLIWLGRLTPPGAIPKLLFEDRQQHLIAMDAVPTPHQNWKERLLSGQLEFARVEQFANLLGTIHHRSTEQKDELARIFHSRTFFETLRIEPYYHYTASRHLAVTEFFSNLIAQTALNRLALVHGDYSPKNILISPDQFVLLDHEVIHWGDPAFDVGFALTHLLSKAHHLPGCRSCYLTAALVFWQTYQSTGELSKSDGFEARAAGHTLGCLLARVDGRSPLEYLNSREQLRQRALTLALISKPPASLALLIDQFGVGLAL